MALFPRSDYAEMLAVPGGEDIDALHCTLAFLGQDVTDMSDGNLGAAVGAIADSYTSIEANVFGHAIFNPDAPGDGDDPAGVYLLTDSPELDKVYNEIIDAVEGAFPIPEQHVPWIPHVTCSYGRPPLVGQYTGPIIFDRLGFAFAGDTSFYPLVGASLNASVASLTPWSL